MGASIEPNDAAYPSLTFTVPQRSCAAIARPRAVSRVKTADNAANLAPVFLDAVIGRYAGTLLGRQELDGEIVEDRPDALWTRDAIEANRVDGAPPLRRIVVAVDPPASSSKRADACGIVAAGVDDGGTAYVLEDATASGLKPPEWAARAVALYRRGAKRIGLD